MKKALFFILVLVLYSCKNKEVQLPQLEETIVANVKDHSPIYMFYNLNGKDTLIEVNRSNSISSTNWLFNIDKRLPLKLVIPEIIKLQAKKESSPHKNETTENFFTYMDNKKKILAFMPIRKINYVFEKPKSGVIVYYDKTNRIFVNSIEVNSEKVKIYLENIPSDKPLKFNFWFDKNLSYEDYLKAKSTILKLKISNIPLNSLPKEFIY